MRPDYITPPSVNLSVIMWIGPKNYIIVADPVPDTVSAAALRHHLSTTAPVRSTMSLWDYYCEQWTYIALRRSAAVVKLFFHSTGREREREKERLTVCLSVCLSSFYLSPPFTRPMLLLTYSANKTAAHNCGLWNGGVHWSICICFACLDFDFEFSCFSLARFFKRMSLYFWCHVMSETGREGGGWRKECLPFSLAPTHPIPPLLPI